MTAPSLGRRKKKITYTASAQGVETAERALKRLGFESKINFAKSQLLAPSTIKKFFQGQKMQLDSFKRICEKLELNWRDIAEREEEHSKRLEINDGISPNTNEGVEQMQIICRQVVVIDKQSKKIKATIVLEGDLNSVNNDLSVSLGAVLRECSGDTIRIININEGSIRLTVEGSQEDIEQLVSRIKSGVITEFSGFPVKDIQILSESSDDDGESNKLDDKWHLVQEIASSRVKNWNLSGIDLSDADLSGAILSGANLSVAILSVAILSDADLSGANLSDADLSGADLSDACLSGAILSGADLYGADLNGADLSDAILSGANLSGAILSSANLKRARIDAQTKIDRKWRLAWEIVNQGARARDLIGINLSGADLSGANLSSADLSSANLSSANLSGADLSGADLNGAYLNRANLSGADLNGAYLNRAYLSVADLNGANLSGADLSGADLSGAILSVAILSVAILSVAILSDADLNGADLSRAILSDADLSGANLSGANVNKAQFGNNLGISELIKQDLIRRGAIFKDFPKDPSVLLVPHRS